jgi:hypothetical protein
MKINREREKERYMKSITTITDNPTENELLDAFLAAF